MGRVSITYLSDSKVWACGTCGTHVTRHDDIVSKQFQGKASTHAFGRGNRQLLSGRSGRAYLFSAINNVNLQAAVPAIPLNLTITFFFAGLLWSRSASGADNRSICLSHV
jgi:hypothetical protein